MYASVIELCFVGFFSGAYAGANKECLLAWITAAVSCTILIGILITVGIYQKFERSMEKSCTQKLHLYFKY